MSKFFTCVFLILILLFSSLSLAEESVSEAGEEEGLVRLGEITDGPVRPEVFGGGIYLSLTEVMARVISNNLDIKLARFDASIKATEVTFREAVFDTILTANVDYAQDRKKRATTFLGTETTETNFDLGLSKRLSSGTDVRLDLSNQKITSDSVFSTLNPSFESTLQLSLTQPLARNRSGILDRGEVLIAQLNLENADFASLDRIESALAQAETDYWDLVLAYRLFEIKQEMLRYSRELFISNKERMNTGLVEEVDILASEANLQLRDTELLLARNAILSAVNKLKLAMNETFPGDIIPQDDFSESSEDISLETALQEAFLKRRDYQQALNDLTAYDIKLAMKKNSRYPELDLTATLARNGLDRQFGNALEDIFKEDNRKYFVGLEFSVPWEGREGESRYTKASLEKARALVQLQKIERILVTEVDEKVRAVKVKGEEVRQKLRVRDLQELKLQSEEKRFKFGRGSVDTLIRFQEDLLQAEVSLFQVLADYNKALLNLKRTQNILLSEWGITSSRASITDY